MIFKERNKINGYIDIDIFVKENQEKISALVNKALNRAGETVQNKVASGEISANLQEVLPVLLYETLLTNTVATLRLVADMLNKEHS